MRRNIILGIALLAAAAALAAALWQQRPAERQAPESDEERSEPAGERERAVPVFQYEDGGGELAVDLGQSLKLFEPNAPVRLTVSHERLAAPMRLVVEAENRAASYKQSRTLELREPDGTETWTWDDWGRNGIYTLSFKLFGADGGQAAEGQVKVGVMPRAAQPADSSFRFGVQPFLFRTYEWEGYTFHGMDADQTYELTWDYLDYLGVNLVRDGNTWSFMEPQEGQVNFDVMDRIVQDSAARGVAVDWHMGATPGWAVHERYKDDAVIWSAPPRMDAWLNYAGQAAKRYSAYDHVIYEIINEPNWEFWTGTAEEYLDLLKRTSAVIKEEHPASFVIPGGMVPRGDKPDELYYRTFKELLAANRIDAVAYHSHGTFSHLREHADVVRGRMADAGIPWQDVWLNESGIQASLDIVQTEEVLRKAVWARAHDHGMFVFYMFRDFAAGGEAGAESGWSMISASGEPRESYIAYGTLIRMLDRTRAAQVIADNKYYAYVFEKDDGSAVFVTFKDGEVPEAGVSLDGDAGARAFDVFGNETAAGEPLKVGNVPSYLLFENGWRPGAAQLEVNDIYRDLMGTAE